MALIPCRECSREISDEALACPHCGAPKEAEPASETTAAVQVERSVEDIGAELKEEKSPAARLRLVEELEERLEKEEARKKTEPPPPRHYELGYA